MGNTHEPTPASSGEATTQALKERWDSFDVREKAHEVEGKALEDERWAIARGLHDLWNPNNVPDEELPPPGSNRAPDGGVSQSALARATKRPRATVNAWIACHRYQQLHAPIEKSFGEVLEIVRYGGAEDRRKSQAKSYGRAALRDYAELMAPEIAEALEKPEVIRAIQEAQVKRTKDASAASPSVKLVAREQEVEYVAEVLEKPEVAEAVVEINQAKLAVQVAADKAKMEADWEALTDEEREEREERERRRQERARRTTYFRYAQLAVGAAGQLRKLGPPDNPKDVPDVLDLITIVVVEAGLAERRVKGEQIGEDEIHLAYAEAAVDRELAETDWDEELRRLGGQ